MVVYYRTDEARMYDTHHFADTRSVKQSEALPLASRGCWLPFCRLPTSSHHPFVRSRLTIPGHLSSLRLVSPNAPSHAPSHASPQARVHRPESSRATSRPIPPVATVFCPLVCRHEPLLCARSRLSILHPLASHPNSTRSILTQLVPSRATNHPRALPPTFSPIFPTGERATTDPGPASCYPLPSRSSLCRNFDFLAPLKSLRILSLSHLLLFCLLVGYFTLVN